MGFLSDGKMAQVRWRQLWQSSASKEMGFMWSQPVLAALEVSKLCFPMVLAYQAAHSTLGEGWSPTPSLEQHYFAQLSPEEVILTALYAV